MQKNSSKQRFELYLPAPLPTWNILLGSSHYKKRKLRNLYRKLTFECIKLGTGSVIRMEQALKQSSMQSLRRACYETMGRKRFVRFGLLSRRSEPTRLSTLEL